MENQIVKISSFQTGHVPTKADVTEMANGIAQLVLDGDAAALEVLGKLKAIEDVIKETRGQIMEAAIMEAERYGSKSFGDHNAKFELKETGVKYDYSQDGEWQSYNDQKKEIEALMKGRETTLKALGQCAKSSTTTVCVTLNK